MAERAEVARVVRDLDREIESIVADIVNRREGERVLLLAIRLHTLFRERGIAIAEASRMPPAIAVRGRLAKAVLDVLDGAGRSMHPKEIAAEIERRGLWRGRGESDHAELVRACLDYQCVVMRRVRKVGLAYELGTPGLPEVL